MFDFLKNIFLILSITVIACSCSFTVQQDQKITGVSLEGSSKPMGEGVYKEFIEINAKWVSLMPYAYMQGESPSLNFKNLNWQWWGEGMEGVKVCTEKAHEANIKVMIKPHVWIGRGEFTGTYTLDTNSEWEAFEKDYKEYILSYANLAEASGAEMLCIGTEMENFVLQRTKFWEELIEEVRSVYNGKLTYAANWNEYTKVPFWRKLDFVGIDAYFPLAATANPSKEELNAGWEKWIAEIETLYNEIEIPIIFTEYGYRSIEGTAIEPWSSGRDGKINLNEQTNAYESLYKNCWDKKWMEGGFLWKWHAPQHNPEKRELRFTPQFKPALKVIKDWYAKHKN